MICEICGCEYVYSCPHCMRSIGAWGQDGLLFLRELAKSEKDITSMDMVNIINTYYIGKTITMGRKATVLRTALRRLGYTGNFVGRIHKDGGTYLAIRRREQSKAKRYGLKKASCDMCGSSELLAIHHIVPLSWGGISSEENCITLCETCHRAAHERLSKVLNRERLLSYLSPHYEEIESLARQSFVAH